MDIRSEFAGSFGAWELSVEGVRWGQVRLPKGADRSQVMQEGISQGEDLSEGEPSTC